MLLMTRNIILYFIIHIPEVLCEDIRVNLRNNILFCSENTGYIISISKVVCFHLKVPLETI